MTSEEKKRLKTRSIEEVNQEIGRKEFMTDLQVMAAFEASGDIHKAESLYMKMRAAQIYNELKKAALAPDVASETFVKPKKRRRDEMLLFVISSLLLLYFTIHLLVNY